jgi:Flp pilus assembly protein TadG
MSVSRDTRVIECQSGATAIEFAILTPAFIMLILGTLSGGLVMYTASSLHYATEAAARCFSVATGKCPNASKTQAYALNLYSGPSSPTPSFTASAQACGQQVVGNLTFVLDAGLAQWSIPLSATACFP